VDETKWLIDAPEMVSSTKDEPPRGSSGAADKGVERIAKACRLIEECETIPTLADLASQIHLSAYHFHRLFKQVTGLTPHQYAIAHRNRNLRTKLIEGATVTEAMHEAGFCSTGHFHATTKQVLGMSAKSFRDGGPNSVIRFAIGECALGAILVAGTERGVCAIAIEDDPSSLLDELQDRFSKATLIGSDPEFERYVAQTIGFVETPSIGLDLPLDIRGTAFQQRVWQALCEIPLGSTASYAEIAERIGSPTSSRAVAGACATNKLALAIPCHRVVRTDGGLSGYRWGVERKRQLLENETWS